MVFNELFIVGLALDLLGAVIFAYPLFMGGMISEQGSREEKQLSAFGLGRKGRKIAVSGLIVMGVGFMLQFAAYIFWP